MQEEEWQAPGPGTWERDRAHFARTVSRPMIDLIEDAAPAGMREGFDLIGAPLDTMDVRFVRGQMYRRLVPIIGASGRGPATPPPPWLMRTVFALHPRLRRRSKVAEVAIEGKSWNDEADRWEATWKPEIAAANRRLGSVDVGALSDGALADHLDELLVHTRDAMALHFRLHISDLGPIALLLDETEQWGIDGADVMAVLAGASPATSAPHDALRPLAVEIERELEPGGSRPATLDEVRGVSDRAARILDDYLLEFGGRLTTGYDITEFTLGEMPDAIIAMLGDPRLLEERTAADLAISRGVAAHDELRSRVPHEHRAEFDELVDDARRLYGLRDENGPITAEWPCGVLRSTLLEVGQRLTAAGRLEQVDHVFDLSGVESIGSLRGEPGPHAGAVASRHRTRLGFADSEAPAHLGPDPVEPDLDGLPDAMGRMMRMSVNAVALLEAADGMDVVGEMRGTGIGTTAYVGRAVVVADAEDAIERCEAGDVLIARFTAPTFNSILGLAGAVVTEHGGLLCHTAVIARELGIAGVVGVAGALSIPDGSQVEVDPVAGRVTVIG
ncbi:PEP-utilizing enzyme [Ilumatobacter sp.]|uniref:PEP-utilizing enzyme n=1 Tax=Ilumatobacter sp. TaxID=1967498 RepID=UPI003C458194